MVRTLNDPSHGSLAWISLSLVLLLLLLLLLLLKKKARRCNGTSEAEGRALLQQRHP